MEEYVAILMIITPGFISKSLQEYLKPGSKVNSEFQRTIMAIVNSIPILFINLVVISFMTRINSIDRLIESMKDIDILILYTMLNLSSTLFYTIIIVLIHPKITVNIANKIRSKRGQNEICEENEVWDCMFSNKEEQAIAIIKGEKEVAKGFVKNWSSSLGDEKGIILEHSEVIEDNPECFYEEKCSYYNIDKDILIKEYSLDQLHSKMNDSGKEEI